MRGEKFRKENEETGSIQRVHILIDTVRDALGTLKICNYTEGVRWWAELDLLRVGTPEVRWNLGTTLTYDHQSHSQPEDIGPHAGRKTPGNQGTSSTRYGLHRYVTWSTNGAEMSAFNGQSADVSGCDQGVQGSNMIVP